MVPPCHEPPFLAPSASDVMDTPRNQRTPEEVATYLKGRFQPKASTRKAAKGTHMGNYLLNLRAHGELGPQIRRLGSLRFSLCGS